VARDLIVIASEREAIQLEIENKALWRHSGIVKAISWIASLTLAMTVYLLYAYNGGLGDICLRSQ